MTDASWIIPPEGEPHRRVVEADDARHLRADGFRPYRLTWKADVSAAPREGIIWATSRPSAGSAFLAINQLFGARDSGTVRMTDEYGSMLLP